MTADTGAAASAVLIGEDASFEDASFVRATAAVILVGLAVRLVSSGLFGADFMESYGVVVSRQFSLSYFDQPPLTWWLIGLTRRLAGTEAIAVVRLPFILAFVAATWSMFRITQSLFTARAGFYAASAFTFAPLFGIYDGTLAQTDGLMELFVLAAVRCLVVVLFDPRRFEGARWAEWGGAGLFLGLALASKYTTVLLLPGFIVVLLTTSDGRRWLRRPEPYVGAALAALPLLPVLVWNAQHHWISFLYQSGRAAWGDGLHPVRALRWSAMQFLNLQPWILIPAVVGLVRGLAAGPRHPRVWLLCCTSAVPVALFPGVVLWSSHAIRGYHWSSIGYLLLIPLVGLALDRLATRRPGAARGWLALTGGCYGVVVALMTTHALTGWLEILAPARMFAGQDPILLELFDWDDLAPALKARGVDPLTTFVTATRWEECAKAAYALKSAYKVICLSGDNIHFSYLADPQSFKGQDAVIVDRYAHLDDVTAALKGHFASIAPAPSIALAYRGRHMMQLHTFNAKGFDGTWPAVSSKGRGGQ